MSEIILIEITSGRAQGNLYWNAPNQLRRKLGRFTKVYVGGVEGGTVRDEAGVCWDWWPTEERCPGEPASSPFRMLRIVKAA